MTLTQLSYILAVAQHRHFAAAADACHVTQPTLSMQIQKLEDELGVTIFDRSRQPVSPTPIGEQILAQARIVVAESQKVTDLIAANKNEVSGQVRLGVIPTLAPFVLPLFVTQFSKSYPKAQLIIEELQTQQIISRLSRNEIDVGLLVTPLHIPTISEVMLFYEPFLLYLSPEHPLMKKSKIKEGDLSANEVWLLNEGHCFRDQVISLCRESNKRVPAALNLRFESGNLETLRKMVDQGSGYTLLPWLSTIDLQETQHGKQLREFQQPVPTREVALVHNKSYGRSAVINALAKEIQNGIPPELRKMKAGSYVRVDLPQY